MVTVCRKVRVNSQGYAYGGRQYFGTGAPLYYYELADGDSGHVRAHSRADAMERLFDSHSIGYCFTCGRRFGSVKFACPTCGEWQCCEGCYDKHIDQTKATHNRSVT